MTDPYKILGVSPAATDDEIKDAYRALVRKYHPDKYANTDLAEMATEKMKEVNAAYEEIQRLRKAGAGNTASGGTYGAYGAYTSTGAGNAQSGGVFAQIRNYVNAGNLDAAEAMLRELPQTEHNAEWNFLMGCVLLRRGATLDAQTYLDTACMQNPYNQEYRLVRDRLRAQSNAYGGGYYTSRNAGSGCDVCTSLLCADCCCECMGGDLIPCC